MSDSEFQTVFLDFLERIQSQSNEQRSKILKLTRDSLNSMLNAFADSGPAAPPKVSEPVSLTNGEDAQPVSQSQQVKDADRDQLKTPHTSVKVKFPSGGQSSISFGDSSADTQVNTSVRVNNLPGGRSQVFNDDAPVRRPPSGKARNPNFHPNRESSENDLPSKTSVRVAHPSGGKSSITFGEDSSITAPSSGSVPPATAEAMGRLSEQQMKDISSAIYRKGSKLREVFQNFTSIQNTRLSSASDFRNGLSRFGYDLSETQIAWIINTYAKSPKDGLDFSDFLRFLGGQTSGS